MVRALTALLVLAGFGCAVDDSGLGPGRTDASPSEDLGPIVDRDAQPVDSFVPGTDSGPRDLGPPVDSFVPPPDMCVASAEVCNGRDDDCNGSIDDGLSTTACDGDGDGCNDGLSGCSSGSATCTGDAAPRAGDACDGPDFGTSADGTLRCMSNALVCDGDCTPVTETCDRSDEDCDGQVDEGGACNVGDVTCRSVVSGGRVYLFCTAPGGGLDFADALAYCEDRGYDMVRVGDTTEQAFLATQLGGMSWWTRGHIHSNDSEERQDPEAWHWSGGDDIDTDLWGGGEPSGNGSCAQLRSTDGLLDDRPCSDRLAFVCEEAVAS